MRILYFGNNRVGWQILKWLREEQEEIVGLVVHPSQWRKYGEEIIQTSGLSAAQIIDGSQLRRPEVLGAISELRPDIGISAQFGFILHRDLLDLLPRGCINIHPAFLPYNRGAYPNVWSLVEETPAGVTIHYIDAGVDTGDIIAQRELPVDWTDTGESLYRKLEHLSVALFQETWALIRSGQAPLLPQNTESGTFHRVQDVKDIDEIDLDRRYTARDLLNILRARTFPPHPGAYFRHGGRKIYLELKLRDEN